MISLGLGLAELGPQYFFVNAHPATGNGDGSSWGNAFTDLGDALRSGIPYEEVWVAEGTYKPGVVRSSKFIIPRTKMCMGGLLGTESIRSNAIDQPFDHPLRRPRRRK